MKFDSSAQRAVSGRAEQVSTRVAFFVAGFGMAAWAPLIPFVKTRLSIEDGLLGFLLLCLGAGSIAAMPLAGVLAARFGCRVVLVGASVLICLTLPILAMSSVILILALALMIFGAGIASLDCVANIQAVIVERDSGHTMMSGFHGLFSVGGIAGAGGIAALLSLGLSPLGAILIVVAVIVAAILYATSGFLTYGGQGDGPAFAFPRGSVLFIGILCFVVFLTEGAVLDWSAVFLISVRCADTSYAGLGYACFATAMTIGRLTGDRVVRRVGPSKILLFGGLSAASGLCCAVAVPGLNAGFVGYALVGLGCSNIVPVLYTAVGRQKTMPEHIAVPAISALGYSGVLAGPAAIGFVAHATSLSVAFLIVAALLVGVAASSRAFRTGEIA